jgi:hypothetical protein
VITVLINHEMAEIAEANAKREDQVDPNDLKERAGNGCPKERVNLDGLDNWAGKGQPEMRSTKVPTKSGQGFSVETIGESSQARTIFPSRAETRLGVLARMTTLTTRRRERPSEHTRMEQQLGEEDCAAVVCCQKPPGCTGIRWSRCRFFTGWCNEHQQRNVGQEANGRVAAPPSLNGLVRFLYEKTQKV